MMPTVIQLQAPVRSFSSRSFVVDGTVEGLREGTLDSPRLLSIEDAWLRGIVSRDPHVNVLVQCSDVSITSAFSEMAELCTRTPCIRTLPGALRLPENADAPLLIGDVSTLMLEQQIDLYDWLDRFSGLMQVVSVTSVPLWSMVQRGRFLEGLFYRLNVVSLTASPGNH